MLMAFGKLYTYKGAPRSIGILAIAHTLGLPIEVVETSADARGAIPREYLALNPLGKTPTFVGADGYVVTECLAIALYVASQRPNNALLGSTTRHYIEIVRWMSLTNTDVVARMAAWIRPLAGQTPYSADAVTQAQRGTAQAIAAFELHLRNHQFLVADRLTVADLVCAGLVSFGFATVFDPEWRSRFPAFSRWYVTVVGSPACRAVVPSSPLCSKALPNVRPQRTITLPILLAQRSESGPVGPISDDRDLG